MAKAVQKESKIVYLQIGQNYENLGVQKQFDVSEWVEEFPNAHIYLLFKRPGEEAAAPVNTELDENGILTWTVSNWETGIIGVGFAEIRAIDTETGLVKKSHVIPCSVEASITDEDTHPDYPSWVDRMITMNEHLESVYDDFDEELTEGVAAIQQEAATQKQTAVDAIQAKGETVIASIPSSYTDLIEALAGYTYNPNRHYDHGEFCWYDDKLWRRREDSAAIVGSWVEADWIEAPLTSFMAELGWDMESYTEQWGAMKAALYGEGITNYESENAYTAGAIVWQFRSNLGDIGFYRAKVDKAAGDPWVAADWEKLVGIDDKYVALFNEFVMVQNAQPDTANNRIWVQPQNTEYQVPTYAEFTALDDDVTGLKSAIENNLSVDVIPLAGLEIGNINSNGDNRDSTTRLRTIKKYPVKAGSYIHVVAGENQVYMIGKYVNNTFSVSGWYSSDVTLKTDDDCEVRFLIRYATESAITIADNKCTPQILSSFDYIADKKLGALQNEMKLVATSLTPQFELGTINDGASSAATNRARTNTFIPVTDESIITVKMPAKNGNFTIYYYKTASENDYIARTNDYWANTEYSIKSEYNGYIKIRFYYAPLVTLTEDDLIAIGELFTVIRPDSVLASVTRELNNVKADVANTWVHRYHVTEIGSLSSGTSIDSTKYCRSSDFVRINKGDVVHLLATSTQYNAAVYFFYENNAGSYCSVTPTLSVEPNHSITYISPVTGYYKFRATYIPQRDMTSNDLTLFNALVYSESSPIYAEVIDTINANPYVPKVANVHSIAHRGFSTAPENTLIAFKQAKKHRFDYVETDVRFTADNVPVLLHDATINRTARDENGNTLAETINIADITYSDLQMYDFGSYKNSYYAGTKIPTFTDFIRLCRNIGLKPFIELKIGTQQQIADLYSIVKSFGMINDVCWLGEGIYLNYIKAIDNTATLCYISRNPSIDVIAGFKTGSNLVIAGIEDNAITNEVVQGCIQNDLPLLDWTINVDETIISSNPYITWYMTNGPMAEHVLYDNDMT